MFVLKAVNWHLIIKVDPDRANLSKVIEEKHLPGHSLYDQLQNYNFNVDLRENKNK